MSLIELPYHQIPQHIIDKACEVRLWFSERGITNWVIAGICSSGTQSTEASAADEAAAQALRECMESGYGLVVEMVDALRLVRIMCRAAGETAAEQRDRDAPQYQPQDRWSGYSDAWYAVAQQLRAHNPRLFQFGASGLESALAEINRLQALDKPPEKTSGEPTSGQFSEDWRRGFDAGVRMHQDRAEAWDAIARKLESINPHTFKGHKKGLQCALDQIDRLAGPRSRCER